jgi:predicted permease
MLESWLRDLRVGARGLRRSPSFALTAILMLSVGIGAVTTVFTEVNAVFLKTLPVNAPEQLRRLSWTSRARAFAGPQFVRFGEAVMARGGTLEGFPYSLYLLMQKQPPAGIDSVACTSGGGLRLVGEGGFVNGLLVSGNFFTTAGARVVLGRPIVADDDRPGAEAVAVISYGFWQRAFGGDANVLGRSTPLKGIPFRIVGVTAEGFAGINPTEPHEVFIPFAARARTTPGPFDPDRWGSCSLLARLRPGVSDDTARAAAESTLHGFIRATPPKEAYELPRLWMTDVSRGMDTLRTATYQPLLILFSMVGATLLIACANVAGLVGARGEARRREIATRLAVGASRARIVRQLLTENLLLCAIGGLLGTLLVYALSPYLPALLREIAEIPSGGAPSRHAILGVQTSPDLRVLIFAILVIACTALIFGLAPALRSARTGLVTAMKPGAPAASRRRRFSPGALVVGAQIVLSMVLIVTAALFVRSVLNLWTVPIGYNPERLLYVTADNITTRPLVDQVRRRLEGLAGVSAVSVSQWPLFTNAEKATRVCVPGVREELVDSDRVTPRFFEAWGTPFVSGRDFGDTPERSVIVNQTFAKRYLPGEPLGQVVGLLGCPGRAMTVVGVVADHTDRPRVPVTPMVYMPYHLVGPSVPMTFTLRTSGNSAAMVATLRRVMSEFPTAVGGDVTTGDEYRDRTLTQVRALSGLVGFFAALAVLLSCLGIYGMLTYAITRRIPEVGVRMALGARARHVVRAVGAHFLAAVAAGIIVGTIVAVIAAQGVSAILFGVAPTDPWILAASAFVLASTAAAAMVRPLLHACRTNPLEALREE